MKTISPRKNSCSSWVKTTVNQKTWNTYFQRNYLFIDSFGYWIGLCACKFVFAFKMNVKHRKFPFFLSKIYSLIIYFDLLLQMERGRCRRIPPSSIQSNSSIANAQCSDLDTHAIVQRETDKKVVLIPLENFINFGKVIKVNDTATFKGNKDSRKVDRGKVLVFGESLVHKYIIKLIFCLFHWRQRRDVCRAITSIARRIFWWKSSVR